MRKTYILLTFFGVLIFASLACNLPLLMQNVSEADDARTIEQTVQAELAASDDDQLEPARPEQPDEPDAPPTATSTITTTPTVTPTATPAIPMASVSRNTNCRTGPGTEYDLVYIFMVGDEAEIIARSSVPNYVIVEVPDGSGRQCWLWMQYGQQEGDTSTLPEKTPPPTPTPEATPTPAIDFTVSFEIVKPCMLGESVFLKISNTGAVTLRSRSVSGTNQDTSEAASSQGDMFGTSTDCITIATSSIAPGGHAFVSLKFTPPIFGDTIDFTVKVCAEDGLGGPCRTRSLSIQIPSPSAIDIKSNFEEIETSEILDRVSDLHISAWTYNDPERGGRHIGPMAGEFNRLFGVGESDDFINAVDSYGVALAAIQGLADISEEQAQEIIALEAQNAKLLERMETAERQRNLQFWVLLIGLMSLGSYTLWVSRKRGRI
jgi:hypothetical protein